MAKLSDFDLWYQPCSHCGYDPGKVSKRSIDEDGGYRCWRCGRRCKRDFSERALKVKK